MTWDDVVDRMLRETAREGPRAEAYWAQQLAFSPVFVHALRLRMRQSAFSPDDKTQVQQLVCVALTALSALPERPGADPAALAILAGRQARAAQWGRRRTLNRMLERLGTRADAVSGEVPDRLTRPYALLGWRPGVESGAGDLVARLVK